MSGEMETSNLSVQLGLLRESMLATLVEDWEIRLVHRCSVSFGCCDWPATWSGMQPQWYQQVPRLAPLLGPPSHADTFYTLKQTQTLVLLHS